MRVTPLQIATSNGHKDAMTILVKAGANINAYLDGGTLLDKAIHQRDIEILKHLLALGADCNKTRPKRYPPITEAINKGYIDIVKILVDAGADINLSYLDIYSRPLHVAISKGSIRALDMLINVGANISYTDEFDRTPLHIAIIYGYDSIIRRLLKAGADINAIDKYGITPRILAAMEMGIDIGTWQ